MILGTAAYMAPEQARGRVADRRADIWAFGAVLFEMLTGKRAFPGEDITDTLAAVVRAEPEWSLLPRDLSPTLVVFLRRCLQKDPKQRVGDIRDVRLALEGAFDVAAQTTAAGSREHRRATSGVDSRGRLDPRGRGTGDSCGAASRRSAALYATGNPDRHRDARHRSFALSPDGRQTRVRGRQRRVPRLWLRSLSDATARPLPGTEGAESLFWSPDNRSIAFFTGTALKRLDLGGGCSTNHRDPAAARLRDVGR